MLKESDFSGQTPAWCPGCGNFPILETLKSALVELRLSPTQILLVSGIGQSGKLPHYMRGNTFNGLHGRTLPVATAAKLANHELTVIAIAGDGDCYGEGGNHFIHAIRRNPNITLLVHNNQIYGLTKGQASPTSEPGTISKTQPFGSLSEPMNPLSLAIALNAGFVARGFAGDTDFLKTLIKEAILHRGFSIVDILQPCVSFNKVNTYNWYRERIYKLGEEHDPTDRINAFRVSLEWGTRIPTGIFYKGERPTLEEQIPVISKTPLVDQVIDFRKRSGELESFRY
ncbi:MAG: 2-oxoacid:ferredoxin oxidoreductase subunit beta [Nitrospirae bacterium]|nr:MAG: 2-oxoacid:ferredoxin oxidoreductase subunit beta [Nitrospirota bacterium]